MNINKHSRLIILGSGPAGYTASIYAARANLNPILITGLIQGGQLTTTNEVDNWPSAYNGILGPDLMNNFLKHSKRFGTEILNDNITDVDLNSKPFQLIGEYNNKYTCEALIISTGASFKKLGLKSEEKFFGKGISNCATCDGFFYKGKDVTVVGGGNTAIEEAIYLSNICKSVTLIHRHDKFKAEPIILEKFFKKVSSGIIKIKLFCTINDIHGNDSNISSLDIFNAQLNQLETIKTDALFIAIGHQPNTSIFKNKIEMSENYLLTKKFNDEFATMTSINGVFAAGDVQDSIYRQAITSAASGCMAAIDAIKWLEYEGK
ncbi:Thioredoxin reductase [Candidatus Kinetoplastibacterium sorsogonicusi]|uniref:Thioredoxin reductase n=1 Tax=Candidatus Kinetoplastidibacterium kentomonadis TaxID=1576550 RepID=A0A3Q8EUD8_9PROT|nr:thioredoxin-disulfide reductase [Candidatus Kinetoplastibacterium sorsogonicusi]AWD32609.1 Thioredoxin reductase [Candidatus Kinetoplastibacterium sorsogonicusi]